MSPDPSNLLDLEYAALAETLAKRGLPAYRAQQIWTAVFQQLVTGYEQITTLPTALREALADDLPLVVPDVV